MSTRIPLFHGRIFANRVWRTVTGLAMILLSLVLIADGLVVFAFIPVLVFLYCATYDIISYFFYHLEIDQEGILIKRKFQSKKILLSSISSLHAVSLFMIFHMIGPLYRRDGI